MLSGSEASDAHTSEDGKIRCFAPAQHGTSMGILLGLPTCFAPAQHDTAMGILLGLPTCFAPTQHEMLRTCGGKLPLISGAAGFFAFFEFAAQDFAGGDFRDGRDELDFVELFVAGEFAV